MRRALLLLALTACPAVDDETDPATDTDTDTDEALPDDSVDPLACAEAIGSGFSVTADSTTIQVASAVFDGGGIWVAYNEPYTSERGTWMARYACDGTVLVEPISLNMDDLPPHRSLTFLAVHDEEVVVSFTFRADGENFRAARIVRRDRRTGELRGTVQLENDRSSAYGSHVISDDRGWLRGEVDHGTGYRVRVSRTDEALQPDTSLATLSQPGGFLTYGMRFVDSGDGIDFLWSLGNEEDGYTVSGWRSGSEAPVELGLLSPGLGFELSLERAGGETLGAWPQEDGLYVASFPELDPVHVLDGDQGHLTVVDDTPVVIARSGGKTTLARLDGDLRVAAETTGLSVVPNTLAPLGGDHVLVGTWEGGRVVALEVP